MVPCLEKAPNTSLKASQYSNLSKSAKKNNRYIPSQPERILDAPDIINDYYLQLVDWSNTNLLAVALNREVYIWNAVTGDIQNLMQVPDGDYISSLSWIQTGNNLAIGTGTHNIQIWDAESAKKLRTMRGHDSRPSCLSWNSHILSSGSRGGEIHNHDVRLPEHLIGKMLSHTQEVCGLKWSPSGQFLASGGNDNRINIWPNMTSSSNVQPIFTLDDHKAAVKVCILLQLLQESNQILRRSIGVPGSQTSWRQEEEPRIANSRFGMQTMETVCPQSTPIPRLVLFYGLKSTKSWLQPMAMRTTSWIFGDILN